MRFYLKPSEYVHMTHQIRFLHLFAAINTATHDLVQTKLFLHFKSSKSRKTSSFLNKLILFEVLTIILVNKANSKMTL